MSRSISPEAERLIGTTCQAYSAAGTRGRRVLAALASAGVVALGLAAGLPAAQLRPGQGLVRLPNGTAIRVEVVATEAARQRGLMFRPSLPASEGMLFVFDEPARHAFWMKNTLIPLDILWLDDGGRVVAIHESVPPCRADPCPTYAPLAPGLYVLEINAGEAAAQRVKVGDVLRLEGLAKP